VQWYNEAGGFTQFTNGPASISSVAAGVQAAEGEDGNTVTTIDSNGNPVTTTNPSTDGDYSILAQVLGNVSGMMFGIAKNDWGAIVNAVAVILIQIFSLHQVLHVRQRRSLFYCWSRSANYYWLTNG